MLNSKISLQMYTMREHTKTIEDLACTIEKLANIGFKTLQYSIPSHYDMREVKKIFDANGMSNDSVFCPSMRLEEDLNKTIAQCELFSTNYVRLDSLPTSLTETPAGYKMYAHYLNEVGAEYKKHGLKLLYHFHAFEFKRFGNTTGIEIILSESDPEVVQIIPDTHWIQSGGKTITEFLEQYKDRYDYMHAKDYDMGPRNGALEARGVQFAPVGEGNINWEPVIYLCKKNNVKSYAIEQDSCYGRDAFDCVKSSFDYLKSMGVDD